MLLVDDSKFKIATTGKADTDGVAFFCELSTQDGIFLDHRIASASPHNAIAMEISLGEFRVALRSMVANLESNQHHDNTMGSSNQTITTIKLAKREGVPCLCLEASTRETVTLHHAIPVRIVRVNETDV